MTEPDFFVQYIGFTEEKVKNLCKTYNKDFNEMKAWYDGYHFDDIHIYNPNSVVKAISRSRYSNYWTQTKTFEDLKEYINLNFDGVKDSITKLIEDESVICSMGSFANDMTSLANADNVLTLLMHLGYLSIQETIDINLYKVVIPNLEIKYEFREAIKDNEKYADIYELVKDTNKLLQSIWNKDEKAVAKSFDINHQKYTSIIKYNDENSLASVIAISLLLSTAPYVSKREIQAGKGFADMIYLPKKGKTALALIIELKYDKTADTAIKQIKEHQYIKYFDDYKSKVLLVGINYDTKSKVHDCSIEEVNL